MEKRLITKKQEQAFRLCHQDFEGLTETEAAERMGVTQATISEHLANVKKVAPQLFPILTKFQAQCYHYITCDGWLPEEIADYMGRPINSVYKALQACRNKGLPLPVKVRGNILRYEELPDPEVSDTIIIRKF